MGGKKVKKRQETQTGSPTQEKTPSKMELRWVYIPPFTHYLSFRKLLSLSVSLLGCKKLITDVISKFIVKIYKTIEVR